MTTDEFAQLVERFRHAGIATLRDQVANLYIQIASAKSQGIEDSRRAWEHARFARAMADDIPEAALPATILALQTQLPR